MTEAANTDPEFFHSNRCDGNIELGWMPEVGADNPGYECCMCPPGVRHKGDGDVFIVHGDQCYDGQHHMVCSNHAPKNSLVYHPKDNTLRTLGGLVVGSGDVAG